MTKYKIRCILKTKTNGENVVDVREYIKLCCVKKGNITDDEFDAEILAIKSSLNSITDSVESLNVWLKGNIFRDEKHNDISEHFDIISKINKQDIIDFAKTVKLDTVYLLSGTQEAE